MTASPPRAPSETKYRWRIEHLLIQFKRSLRQEVTTSRSPSTTLERPTTSAQNRNRYDQCNGDQNQAARSKPPVAPAAKRQNDASLQGCVGKDSDGEGV